MRRAFWMAHITTFEEQQLKIERDKLQLEKKKLKQELWTRVLTLLAIFVSALAIALSSWSEKKRNEKELEHLGNAITAENAKLKSDITTSKRIELFKKLTEKSNDPETVVQTYKAIFPEENSSLGNIDLSKLRE